MTWLPIDDPERPAPKGRPVLLWKPSTNEHYVAAMIRGAHGPGWCTPDGFQIFGATHYAELPPPPQS